MPRELEKMLRRGLWSREGGALESPEKLHKERNAEQERGVQGAAWGSR